MNTKTIIKELEKKYPPVFIMETEYGVGRFLNGKQGETCITRIGSEAQEVIDDIYKILNKCETIK